MSDSREVRIFISSTFEDNMCEIRKYIMKEMTSSLMDEFKGRNVVINIIDLRWGIREGEDMDVTMDICLDEIDRCQPIFVGIVGEKYGTSIPLHDLKRNPRWEGFNNSIESEYNDYDLSATELEMQYAVLQRKYHHDMESVFLLPACYKKPHKSLFKRFFKKTTISEDEKVVKLIEKIKKEKEVNDKIKILEYLKEEEKTSGSTKHRKSRFANKAKGKYYNTTYEQTFPVESCNMDSSPSQTHIKVDYAMLEGVISGCINNYLKDKDWNLYDEISRFQVFEINILSNICYPQNEDYIFLKDFIRNEVKPVLAIHSDDAQNDILIANWLKNEKQSCDNCIVSCFLPPQLGQDRFAVLSKYIRNKTNVNSESDNLFIFNVESKNVPQIWNEIQNNVSSNKKTLLFIPNVDEYDLLCDYISMLLRNPILWGVTDDNPRNISHHVQFIFTFRDETKLERLKEDHSMLDVLKLKDWNSDELEFIFRSYLSRYGKQNGIAQSTYDMLCNNHKISCNAMLPLLDYFVIHSSYDSVDKELCSALKSVSTTQDIYRYVLDKFFSQDGKIDYYTDIYNRRKQNIERMLCLLAISHNGLPLSDILEMCDNISVLDILLLERYFHNVMINFGGRLRITDESFESFIERNFLNNNYKEENLRNDLILHYRDRCDNIALEVLLYQYQKLDNFDGLYELVAKNIYSVFYFLINRTIEYINVWEYLWTINKDRYKVNTVLNLLNSISMNLKDKFILSIELSDFLNSYCAEKNLALLCFRNNDIFERSYKDISLQSLSYNEQANLLKRWHIEEDQKEAIELLKKSNEGMRLFYNCFPNNASLNGIIKRAEKLYNTLLDNLEDAKEWNDNKTLINEYDRYFNKIDYIFDIMGDCYIALPKYHNALKMLEVLNPSIRLYKVVYTKLAMCYQLCGNINASIDYSNHVRILAFNKNHENSDVIDKMHHLRQTLLSNGDDNSGLSDIIIKNLHSMPISVIDDDLLTKISELPSKIERVNLTMGCIIQRK